MITGIGADDTGAIPFAQYLLLMMTTKMEEQNSKDEISKAFRLFDDNNTGPISFKNLKQVSIELGENLMDEEPGERIEEADNDNDGEVSNEEFVHIMKKTSLFETARHSAERGRRLVAPGHGTRRRVQRAV